MERSSDHNDLATALAEIRPAPRENFVRELDERAAAGFPRRSRLDNSPLAGFAAWVRSLSPQRLLFAGGTAALAAIAIATVLVAGTDSRQQPAPEQGPSSGLLSDLSGSSESTEPLPPSTTAPKAAGTEYGATENLSATAGPARAGRAHRDIERSAEVGLLADPADVADDSAAVFAAVHDANGIVLRSTTTSGKRAGAHFELLIPSARLGDALAAFSSIDEVRTRHEATDDITAPTVETSERLRDSQARIDGLLAQLSAAETETEMDAIEAELARERRHTASLRAQLDRLEQRADFSRVSVKIETGDSSDESGGTWGIGDAFDDAGHILGIAAGVTLIGLAVLGPLALIALLAWLAHRAWVRAQRRRALRGA
jgi:hypothetical protein